MPKLRAADVEDLDVEYLDSVEYSTEDYAPYAGETPPVGLTLAGAVKRMWWTRSAQKTDGTGNDPMLKILWVAQENEGDLEQYNDCPFWINAPLIPGAKFRWDPFLLNYGLTLRDVKTKTYINKDEDQNGWEIQRIGTWHPGFDHEESWSYVVTGREPYNGDWKPLISEWIPWDEYEAEDEEPEEVEDEAEGEDEDEEYEDEEYEDEDEEDEEPEPEEEPATVRSRRTPAKARSAQPARAARTASKPATAKTGTRARSAPASRSTARTASRSA